MAVQAVSDDIGLLAQTNGLGTMGVNMFIVVPSAPDNLVALIESTGFEPTRTMGGIQVETFNLQVLVRNLKTTDAFTKARAFLTLLDGFKGLIGTTLYLGILARHSPFPLGLDENKRHRWTCNYLVNRERT